MTSEDCLPLNNKIVDLSENTQSGTKDTVSDTDSIMDYLENTTINDNMKPETELDNDKPIIPGIDLGTTNSCISIWRNNNCEIIPDEFGNKTIPSFVSYTNVSKYVGQDAKNQKDINIENVFYEVKRLIGRTYSDKAVQDCKDLLSYNIIENDRGCVSLQSTVRGDKIFTPEEISACVLMKLKDMAQKYLKREIKDVVITVPAHFNDSQRQATYDAAKIAGLNCVRMFHEPTAAALAYGMMDRSINRALNTIKEESDDDSSGSDSRSSEDNHETETDADTESEDVDNIINDDIDDSAELTDETKIYESQQTKNTNTIPTEQQSTKQEQEPPLSANNTRNTDSTSSELSDGSDSDVYEYVEEEIKKDHEKNNSDENKDDKTNDDNDDTIGMCDEKTISEIETSKRHKHIKKHKTSDDDLKGMMILVYDLGGGTLDVSLIDVYDGAFSVQGSSGISHFGGVDFDNRLINFCIAKFSKQFYRQNEKLETNRLSRVSLQKLRTQCESAKKILSTNAHAIIAIENFHDDKDMFVKISRTDFENLCRDLFLLCIHSVDELLTECGKTEHDIDEVILVGGMTRMPYIRELLNNKFRNENGQARVNCSINPDEAVSIGAAVQGYYIANRDDAFSSSVTLMDVTPLSLGVEVIGGVMDVLIKRNTMIPCEKSKLYSTDTDYVDSVLVKIFEGERTMTKHNYKVGEFELDKIPECQRGIPEIEICFSIDINGIVTVSAMENDVKEKKSIIVNTNKNGLKPHQLQALVEEAIEQETMDEIDRVKKFSYYEMEDLCANVMTNIANKEFKLTKRDVQTINDDMTQILAWLKEKSYRDRELEEFEDALHKMKKKYGVLILHGKLEDNKVKANADHMEATTLYGKDDDEEEEEMRQAFEKVKNDEIGGEGMSDQELVEIKDMRDALMMTCKEITNVICSGRMNITRDHKQEILHYVDDVMMWYYSHEKPTKIDYKEKIDYINSICDEIVEKYEKEGKELFDKSELDLSTDTKSQKLEKMCLTLITMIKNKQLRGSTASFALFTHKLQNILKFVYTKEFKDETVHNDKDTSDVHSNISEQDFQMKCHEYMMEVNSMCDNIYNNTQGINMRSGPVVYTSKPKSDIVKDTFNLNQRLKGKDTQKTDNAHVDQQGTSLVDLLRIKQNEEIEQMIDNQIMDKDLIADEEHVDKEIMNNDFDEHTNLQPDDQVDSHIDGHIDAIKAMNHTKHTKQEIAHRCQDKRQLFMTR